VITVTSEIKDRFFDRVRVIETIHRQELRRLSRAGAFVRRRARTDILRKAPKKRKGKQRRSARAGQPPLVHTSDSFANLRNILFGLSENGNAVVIGPRVVPSLRLTGSSAQTVPELLTFGGTARIEMWANSRKGHGSESVFEWMPGSAPQADLHRTITARYAAHPFMGPALEKEITAGTFQNG
jgi:hypothetical protein